MDIMGAKTVIARPGIAPCIMGLVLLLACAAPLGAQIFVEGGAGWNHVPVQPSTTGRVLEPHGFNLRAAIGKAITPRVRVRVDAFTIQFTDNDNVQVCPYSPDSFPGCGSLQHESSYSGNVSGMTATALVNLDRRGFTYVVGGAGMFFDADVVFKYHYPLRGELRLGVSAGAGLSVPVGPRLRAFAEARWNGPFRSNNIEAPWIVPVTLGLRY